MSTKSFAQIYEQWQRIREYSVNRGWYEQVCSAAIRYQANIMRYLRYFPSEMRIYDEMKENTAIPASIYAKQTEV